MPGWRRTPAAALSTLVILAGALIPPPSDASQGTRFRTPPLFGPVALTGSLVVWSERSRAGSTKVVRAPFDGTPRTALLSRTGTGLRSFSALVSGSPRRLAVQLAKALEDAHGDTSTSRTVFTGPSTGGLAKLEGPCPFYESPFPTTIDLADDRVIHHACDPSGIEVTNLRTRTSVRIPAASDRGLRIAGAYASWVEGHWGGGHDRIVVYDLAQRKVAYRIPQAQTSHGVEDLDLAGDGTLVASTGSVVGWASPKAPSLHGILTRDMHYSLRLVGHKFVFSRGSGLSEMPRAELGISDLQGNVRILARGMRATGGFASFDFDGHRVAWSAYGCAAMRMHVQPLDSPTITESMTRCALRLLRPPAIVDNSYLDLRFDCWGYGDLGCDARDIAVKASDAGRDVVIATGDNEHRLPLTPAGRQLLKERGSLDVRIRATIRSGSSGDAETRHGHAVIEAP